MGKRNYGTGHLYEKHGGYYGRWRGADGRLRNRRIGPMRTPASSDGLTRAQAERAFRKLQEEDERRPRPAAVAPAATIATACESYRRNRALAGASKAYRQNMESMQRVHLAPHFGERPLTKITVADIEAFATKLLQRGLSPKTVRNTLTFLHSVLEHAVARGWCTENAAARATRPKRKRAGDAATDLQFLSVTELDAVLRAIPDHTVERTPAPTRNGRKGLAPPPPPDVLGPVLRVVPHGGDDGAAAVRAARAALARHRLGCAADPRPQRVGARRALGRREVRPLDPPVRADG